jgi:glycosyltransferase involved in cell wall biosynthesis
VSDSRQKFDAGEPLISVIVCTRNRAELLGNALASVTEQDFPRSDYEILVIDNGSTDHTPEVAKRFEGKAVLRYFREERLGLCIARNTGWRAAMGRYVAFFDDDALAAPGWLSAIRDGFQTAPEFYGVIGGRVDPMWEQARPSWLADEIAFSLTIVDWGPHDKFIEDIRREWLVGSNMALPKPLLEEVGGFHPWLDRVGSNLLSSGDVFLQKEVMRRGHRCLYRPSMAIKHLVPGSRLNHNWFFRRYYWQGVSDAVMHLIENTPSPAERVQAALARGGKLSRLENGSPSLRTATNSPEEFSATCMALIDVGFVAGMLGAAGH